MPKKSLASRALMALALTIGFYALALSIAGGLLFAVYLELVYSNHIYVKATLFAVVGAGLILWSILPRFDRFVAPGPRLDETSQPDLFALIREVAAATEQPVPREVYLIPDVNAWVAQRGGMAGIGSRRVMAVGLALLQSLNVDELRAVIAHEFGHYCGGDTKLGVWVYKTRAAIVRTVNNLGKTGGSMQKPFLWYGTFFLRVTQAISRAQEHAADLLAAKVAGARNAINALVATHRAAAAYTPYWNNEVLPVLSNGFRPPIAAGLTQFMNDAAIQTELGKFVERELAEGQGDEYDSHPPLRERVAALEPLAAGETPAQSPLASTLLRDLESLEVEVVRNLFTDPAKASTLTQLDWRDTASKVYQPMWRSHAVQYAGALRELNMVGAGDAATSVLQFAVRLNLVHIPKEEAAAKAKAVLGCAIATRLMEEGWACNAAPGAPITLTKDGRTIAPFLAVKRMASGEMTAAAWAEECAAAGIAERPLA